MAAGARQAAAAEEAAFEASAAAYESDAFNETFDAAFARITSIIQRELPVTGLHTAEGRLGVPSRMPDHFYQKKVNGPWLPTPMKGATVSTFDCRLCDPLTGEAHDPVALAAAHSYTLGVLVDEGGLPRPLVHMSAHAKNNNHLTMALRCAGQNFAPWDPEELKGKYREFKKNVVKSQGEAYDQAAAVHGFEPVMEGGGLYLTCAYLALVDEVGKGWLCLGNQSIGETARLWSRGEQHQREYTKQPVSFASNKDEIMTALIWLVSVCMPGAHLEIVNAYVLILMPLLRALVAGESEEDCRKRRNGEQFTAYKDLLHGLEGQTS
jgi:hypothetical protein